MRGLTVDDMFDDFFTLIARDGAGLLEVDIRLIKALGSLARIAPDRFGQACIAHVDLLLKRAEQALSLEEDKQRLRTLVQNLEWPRAQLP